MKIYDYVLLKGFDRPSEEIAIDLIHAASGVRLPLPKIRFGRARSIDQRTEVVDDEDSFVPVEIDENYDGRFPGNNGFLYRRIPMSVLTKNRMLQINPPAEDFYLHDVLDQINQQLNARLSVDDVVNRPLNVRMTQVRLQAAEQSLVWTESATTDLTIYHRLRILRVTQDGKVRDTASGALRTL